VLPQPPDLGLQALDLGRLLAGHARTGSVVDLGLGQPAPHGLARDALLTGDRGHRRSHGGVLLGVLAHEPHAPRAQLGIDLLRHAVYPLGLKQQRHQTRDGSGLLDPIKKSITHPTTPTNTQFEPGTTTRTTRPTTPPPPPVTTTCTTRNSPPRHTLDECDLITPWLVHTFTTTWKKFQQRPTHHNHPDPPPDPEPPPF